MEDCAVHSNDLNKCLHNLMPWLISLRGSRGRAPTSFAARILTLASALYRGSGKWCLDHFHLSAEWKSSTQSKNSITYAREPCT
jgi:hypothetical protein